MTARPGFLLAIGLGAFVVIWWALSSFSVVPAVCEEINQFTHYRGPISSFCLRHFLSRESADWREGI
jgi:hypothetical protein